VWYGYNLTQCVDSTRMRMIFSSNGCRYMPAA
jgi:hypothetical protein